MNAVHPTFSSFLASIAPPPTEADRIAADLTYNQDKAHQRNNEAFIKSMQEQIQSNPEHWGIE